MPEVKVSHADITADDATKAPPPKQVIPSGVYHAAIMQVVAGLTKTTPPLNKITVEYQILFRADDKNTDMQGRRVFQDYVLEKMPTDERLSQTWRKELTELLIATGTPYTAAGFNTDHLLTKEVKIQIIQRAGRVMDPETKTFPIFNGVKKVDTATDIPDGDIV